MSEVAIHCACHQGDLAKLTELLQKVTVESISASGCLHGEPPLHVAARYGQLDCLNALLAHGADPNMICNDRTALHLAAGNGHRDVMVALLNHGADENAKTDFGYSPLHYASKSGHIRCIQALFETGEDQEKALLELKHMNEYVAHEIVEFARCNPNPFARTNSGLLPVDLSDKHMIQKYLREQMKLLSEELGSTSPR